MRMVGVAKMEKVLKVEKLDESSSTSESSLGTTAVAVGCPSETNLAGKASVCEGCPGRQLCLNQSTVSPDQMLIDVRMKAIKRKILILSGKGGVGKSSIACTLAVAFGNLCGTGKVGVLDTDICGPSLPKLLNVDNSKVINSEYGWLPIESPHCGIKVMSVGSLTETSSSVVWRGPRKTALIRRFLKDVFWGRLEYLVIDTPPGTSDEHLTVTKGLATANPDGAIIVTTPQDVSLSTVRKELNFCRKMNIKVLGIIENMSEFICPCCKEIYPIFAGNKINTVLDEFDIPLLGRIPLDPNIAQCSEEGKNFLELYPKSSAAIGIMNIAKRIQQTY